jgi:hypothetical protein
VSPGRQACDSKVNPCSRHTRRAVHGANYDHLLKAAAASLDDYQRFQMQHVTPLRAVRNLVTENPLGTTEGVSSLPV